MDTTCPSLYRPCAYFLPKSSAKVNDNITTIQQIKVCSINVHGTLTKAEQAELLGDRNIVLKAAPPTHRDRPN